MWWQTQILCRPRSYKLYNHAFSPLEVCHSIYTGTELVAPKEQSSVRLLILLSELRCFTFNYSLRGDGGRRAWGVGWGVTLLEGSSFSDKYIATHPTGPTVWDGSQCLMWACLSCTTTRREAAWNSCFVPRLFVWELERILMCLSVPRSFHSRGSPDTEQLFTEDMHNHGRGEGMKQRRDV